MVADRRGRGCERECGAHKRDPVLFKQLFNTSYLRADDAGLGNHQRLMPITDVVREQYALLGGTWFDDKHRLGPLDNHDDGFSFVEDETVPTA